MKIFHNPSFLIFVAATKVSATTLTEDSFQDLASGKASFIQFCKSSDSACKEFSTTWSDLSTKYDGSDKFLVGQVDCDNSENEFFCEEYYEDASGPVIRYGSDMLEHRYDGDLDPTSMSGFIADLTIPCSVAYVDKWCNAEEIQLIEQYRTMPLSELEELIDTMNNAFEQQYEEAEAKIDAAEEVVKAAKKTLKEAQKSGDNSRIDEAETKLDDAQSNLDAVEADYDKLLDEDQPVTLTLMEEIQDERDMAEAYE